LTLVKRPTRVTRRRVALLLLGGVVAPLVSACSSYAPQPAPGHVSKAPPAVTFTNRQITIRETRRLVVLPDLPPDRSPMFEPPHLLVRPQSTLSGGSLADTTRFWRVRMGIADARQWIADHPPTGLTASGTSSGVMSGSPTVYGYQYADEDSDAWTRASLQIAVVSAGPGLTFWRLDAMALWLDSKPLRVPPDGARLAVTVESGCPVTDHQAVSVAPSHLETALLPAGRPAEALVCRYAGDGTLTSHTRLLAAAAAELAALAGNVSFGHVDNQVIHCPIDTGAHIVIAFRYPDGEIGTLWYRASGCPAVDNGTVFAGVGTASDALFAALAKLR
jgi:hypothetical protein